MIGDAHLLWLIWVNDEFWASNGSWCPPFWIQFRRLIGESWASTNHNLWTLRDLSHTTQPRKNTTSYFLLQPQPIWKHNEKINYIRAPPENEHMEPKKNCRFGRIVGGFNPIEKIWSSKLVIFPKNEIKSKTYLSCHHLVKHWSGSAMRFSLNVPFQVGIRPSSPDKKTTVHHHHHHHL